MRCGDDMNALIHGLYKDLLDPNRNQPFPHHYFLDHTILSARNKEVNEINSTVLDHIHGEKLTYLSATQSLIQSMDTFQRKCCTPLSPQDFPFTSRR
ncbi:hypothetical protein ID866_11096 [Astraeus odoratus]|nr:hypothetical protein ID866_11096 [Astraeus odoratus]